MAKSNSVRLSSYVVLEGDEAKKYLAAALESKISKDEFSALHPKFCKE